MLVAEIKGSHQYNAYMKMSTKELQVDLRNSNTLIRITLHKSGRLIINSVPIENIDNNGKPILDVIHLKTLLYVDNIDVITK